MKVAPHLVRPLEFLLPVYKHDKPGLFVLDVGLWIYDGLSKFSSPKLHRTVRAPRLGKLEPGLKREELDGGLLYYDCTTDDARLTLENIIDARALGATIVNYTRAVKLLRDGDRIAGAEVQPIDSRRRQRRGATVAVRAKVTINATGPWTDDVRELAGEKGILHASKGVHLVVDAKRLAPRHAVVMKQKKRIVFCIPVGAGPHRHRHHRHLLGRAARGRAHRRRRRGLPPRPRQQLLSRGQAHARRRAGDVGRRAAAHQARQRRGDGVGRVARAPHPRAAGPGHHRRRQADDLPAHGGRGRRPRGQAARRHRAVRDRDAAAAGRGRADLLGGLRGRDRAAGAARGRGRPSTRRWPSTWRTPTARARRRWWRASKRSRRSASGSIPSSPTCMAQVDVAVDEEQALTVEDVLGRRLQLLLRARDQGLGCTERVARRMAARLGWDEARTTREIEHYRAVVASAFRAASLGLCCVTPERHLRLLRAAVAPWRSVGMRRLRGGARRDGAEDPGAPEIATDAQQ